MFKYTQAVGNGQSQCRLCRKKGIYNVNWTVFMYKIEGMEGYYCYSCVKELESEYKNEERSSDNV